jgi:hypothetical protein
MFYETPVIEKRDQIGAPFVLGGSYVLSPTWTDADDGDQETP